jgi:hypothetical protein
LDHDPPDDPQERITNPQRFQLLHEAAWAQIECLVADYVVERRDGEEDLDHLAAGAWPRSPATTLVPVGGGAPLTLTLTSFPGVDLHFGYHGHRSYPACGCDACDEDPLEEAGRLAADMADVVAGGFVETRHRRILDVDIYESLLTRRDGSGRVRNQRPMPDLGPEVPVGTTDWPPWRRAS